ncbi:hypothetical protein A2U01_0077189 [Trifolium medium]|uniref:Uncharacterized protein n=1 Tax=Trifolium medium TaxID=97028 RepID=A0A392T4C5_9FABA|nr:hypothetical protein [Trifolium medium]
MRPLLPGDPPRPCEQEALTREEAEREGAIATSLTTKINKLRRIAEDLLSSGELQEGSRAQRDVQEIWETENYARVYWRRGGPSGHATQ